MMELIPPPSGAPTGTVHVLHSPLTIPHVAEAHAALRDAIAAGAEVLDLSAATECDSAGAQLLMAAARSVRQRGGEPGRLAVFNVPPAAHEVLTRYGLLANPSTAQ